MSSTALLRLFSVSQWMAALSWLAWSLRAQSIGLALLGVVAIALVHAPVMAVEITVAHALNRHDAAPRARVGELLRAWLAEVVGALKVFGWQQPWRSHRFADIVRASSRRGVILVHGFVCNRGVWNDWLPRLRAIDAPCIAVELNPVSAGIDAYVSCVDAAVRRMTAHTGRPPLVVAHSMGGLVVRAWLCSTGATQRVHHVVTIGSPHRGTWLAHFGLASNARQMRPDSAWLRELATREDDSVHRLFTCFYSHCDNIVAPCSAATLPDADNRHLRGMAHVHLLQHPAVFAEVLSRLD